MNKSAHLDLDLHRLRTTRTQRRFWSAVAGRFILKRIGADLPSNHHRRCVQCAP